MAKITKEEFVAALKEMSLLEIKELVDGLKEEFGIDPTAVAVAGPAAAEESSGPSVVSVWLNSDGGNKVAVIKVIREITGVGLMDAKKTVESAPVVVKEDISSEEAEPLLEKLKAAGAEAEAK